jgi:putative acetyltransferase
MNVVMTREKQISADGLRLIELLTAELNQRYEDLDGSGHFTPAEVLQENAVFVVARLDGEAVACGAIRPLEEGVAELKIMYTEPRARGLGIARMVMREL